MAYGLSFSICRRAGIYYYILCPPVSFQKSAVRKMGKIEGCGRGGRDMGVNRAETPPGFRRSCGPPPS